MTFIYVAKKLEDCASITRVVKSKSFKTPEEAFEFIGSQKKTERRLRWWIVQVEKAPF